MADPIKPEESIVPVTETPKTKEEWDNLAKTDPVKWGQLTQQRMDTIFRQNKEFQEKLTAAEQRENNLKAEIEKYKTPIVPESIVQGEQYGPGRYPQTEDAWNDLFLERPAFATDLRNHLLSETNKKQQDFVTTREQGVKLVYQEHPEMFVQELDDIGKSKLDGKGKPILKINPQDGQPYFNSESEKGKLWLQIYNEDKEIWDRDKNLPRHIMAEMERRLRQKGANMVNKGQDNLADNDQSGVAPQGVTPPKASSLKFNSEEERSRAQQAIARGVYKNEEDFLKWRDTDMSKGYAEPNRKPDFTKGR